MPKTTFFTPSNKILMTCFMLVLVVFSTTMRFVGVENIEVIKSNCISLDKCIDKNTSSSTSDNKKEKEPLSINKATSSDALLQAIVKAELLQNAILTPSIEFNCTSLSSQIINSVTYYFSSSTFFKTLFSCFISPNAP